LRSAKKPIYRKRIIELLGRWRISDQNLIEKIWKELINILNDDHLSSGLRWQAVDVLPRLRSTSLVLINVMAKALISRLRREQEYTVRSSIFNSLSYLSVKDPTVIKEIIKAAILALKTDKDWVRIQAAATLTKYKIVDPKLRRESVDALINILKDKKRGRRGLRSDVAEALGKLKDLDPQLVSQVAAPLIQALKRDSYWAVRENAIKSLSKLKVVDEVLNNKIATALIRALSDSDSNVRESATLALANFKIFRSKMIRQRNKALLKILFKKMLHGNHYARRIAAEILVKIDIPEVVFNIRIINMLIKLKELNKNLHAKLLQRVLLKIKGNLERFRVTCLKKAAHLIASNDLSVKKKLLEKSRASLSWIIVVEDILEGDRKELKKKGNSDR